MDKFKTSFRLAANVGNAAVLDGHIAVSKEIYELRKRMLKVKVKKRRGRKVVLDGRCGKTKCGAHIYVLCVGNVYWGIRCIYMLRWFE